jgi:hypothetical protein
MNALTRIPVRSHTTGLRSVFFTISILIGYDYWQPNESP